jgi:BclB C-terminal domain-containing protein
MKYKKYDDDSSYSSGCDVENTISDIYERYCRKKKRRDCGCNKKYVNKCDKKCIVKCCCKPIEQGQGTIIPYASGATPVVLANLLGGTLTQSAVLGFGSSANVPVLFGGQINLTNEAAIQNFAFQMPRDGTLTRLYGTFTLLANLTLPANNVQTVELLLYTAPANSFVFTFTGISVPIATYSQLLTVAPLASSNSLQFFLPAPAGTQILLVVASRLTNVATPLINAVTGVVSAGLNIL